MKFRARDFGEAPFHWHIIIVVGSVDEDEGFVACSEGEGGV